MPDPTTGRRDYPVQVSFHFPRRIRATSARMGLLFGHLARYIECPGAVGVPVVCADCGVPSMILMDLSVGLAAAMADSKGFVGVGCAFPRRLWANAYPARLAFRELGV